MRTRSHTAAVGLAALGLLAIGCLAGEARCGRRPLDEPTAPRPLPPAERIVPIAGALGDTAGDDDAADRNRELPPLEITGSWLARGRQRFDIYCAVCHGRVGDGVSPVARAGLVPAPANLHQDRLRQQPIGHFYAIASRGTSAMPAFGATIAATDRWAIAAYARALQLSQDADVGLVPTEVRLANGWER